MLPTSNIDISVLGRILLCGFDELNSKKFKLAVIFSLMNGKSCKIFNLSGKVLRLFKNKKAHSASFRVRIDEAINALIADRVLLRFGKSYSSLKLADDYLDTFNKLKLNIDSEEEMNSDLKKNINLVDSFAKEKADYLPNDTINNPDEIIWFLKSVIVHIRQRAGSNSCKDCDYIAKLSEYCFEHIDQSQFNTHVDYDDERLRILSLRLKSLYYKASDEVMRIKKNTRL